jgi:hypothetical protein
MIVERAVMMLAGSMVPIQHRSGVVFQSSVTAIERLCWLQSSASKHYRHFFATTVFKALRLRNGSRFD